MGSGGEGGVARVPHAGVTRAQEVVGRLLELRFVSSDSLYFEFNQILADIFNNIFSY